MSEEEIRIRLTQIAVQMMLLNTERDELEEKLMDLKPAPPDLGVKVSDGLGIKGEMK